MPGWRPPHEEGLDAGAGRKKNVFPGGMKEKKFSGEPEKEARLPGRTARITGLPLARS